jgi:hypothetical protein
LAFGRSDVATELKFTNDQRSEFMALLQRMQGEIEPLVKEVQSKGNGDVIRPRAMKSRALYAGKIESLLTANLEQKWKSMLGDRFDSAE